MGLPEFLFSEDEVFLNDSAKSSVLSGSESLELSESALKVIRCMFSFGVCKDELDEEDDGDMLCSENFRESSPSIALSVRKLSFGSEPPAAVPSFCEILPVLAL